MLTPELMARAFGFTPRAAAPLLRQTTASPFSSVQTSAAANGYAAGKPPEEEEEAAVAISAERFSGPPCP